MRTLRSRWTVVALVPACFLAGFGIMSAVAGGSDDPEPGAAPVDTTGGARSAGVTSEGQTGAESPRATDAAPATSTGDGGGGGAGGGGAPPAPPPGVIDVDYGEWDGMFELQNPAIQPDLAQAGVLGELKYFGGLDCPVGLVRVKVWFYNEGGRPVGSVAWESGGEVTGREPFPFEALARISEGPASAALRFTAAECL